MLKNIIKIPKTLYYVFLLELFTNLTHSFHTLP